MLNRFVLSLAAIAILPACVWAQQIPNPVQRNVFFIEQEVGRVQWGVTPDDMNEPGRDADVALLREKIAADIAGSARPTDATAASWPSHIASIAEASGQASRSAKRGSTSSVAMAGLRSLHRFETRN